MSRKIVPQPDELLGMSLAKLSGIVHLYDVSTLSASFPSRPYHEYRSVCLADETFFVIEKLTLSPNTTLLGMVKRLALAIGSKVMVYGPTVKS